MNVEFIWDKYHHRLRKFIEQRVRNQFEVDDILQKVFIKINAHLPDLKDENKVQSWIYQITRNTIIDFYRTEKQIERIPDHFSLSDDDSVQNFTQEAAACIRSTMQRLPDKYREALELSEFHGLSQKELSEKLGISYSGAKSRVQRGRIKLKKLMVGCCHIEPDLYGNIIEFHILKD